MLRFVGWDNEPDFGKVPLRAVHPKKLDDRCNLPEVGELRHPGLAEEEKFAGFSEFGSVNSAEEPV